MSTDSPAAPASGSTLLGFAAAVTQFGDRWRIEAGSQQFASTRAGSPEHFRARAILTSNGPLRPDQHDFWVMVNAMRRA